MNRKFHAARSKPSDPKVRRNWSLCIRACWMHFVLKDFLLLSEVTGVGYTV
jgi:hypothetical protein